MYQNDAFLLWVDFGTSPPRTSGFGNLTRHDQALTSTFLETEKGSENHMILGKGKILDIPQFFFYAGIHFFAHS